MREIAHSSDPVVSSREENVVMIGEGGDTCVGLRQSGFAPEVTKGPFYTLGFDTRKDSIEELRTKKQTDEKHNRKS